MCWCERLERAHLLTPLHTTPSSANHKKAAAAYDTRHRRPTHQLRDALMRVNAATRPWSLKPASVWPVLRHHPQIVGCRRMTAPRPITHKFMLIKARPRAAVGQEGCLEESRPLQALIMARRRGLRWRPAKLRRQAGDQTLLLRGALVQNVVRPFQVLDLLEEFGVQCRELRLQLAALLFRRCDSLPASWRQRL